MFSLLGAIALLIVGALVLSSCEGPEGPQGAPGAELVLDGDHAPGPAAGTDGLFLPEVFPAGRLIFGAH